MAKWSEKEFELIIVAAIAASLFVASRKKTAAKPAVTNFANLVGYGSGWTKQRDDSFYNFY